MSSQTVEKGKKKNLTLFSPLFFHFSLERRFERNKMVLKEGREESVRLGQTNIEEVKGGGREMGVGRRSHTKRKKKLEFLLPQFLVSQENHHNVALYGDGGRKEGGHIWPREKQCFLPSSSGYR